MHEERIDDRKEKIMNLLEMLGGSLTQKESVDNIAKKSKSSNAQIIKLVALWLPLLMTYLTRNARKEGGTRSLANALGQHKDTNSLASQIEDADTEDGEKILKHILGDDEDQVTKNLAKQAGMDQSQVISALDAMLPGIMSGISSSASQAARKQKSGVDLSDGIDLTDIMGMLGGSSASGKSSGMGLESLLGGFLGTGAPKKSADAKKADAKKASSGSSVSKAELEKAKYEAEIAKAKAEKAKAEAELAKLQAEQAKADRSKSKKETTDTKKSAGGNSALEGLMGQLLGGTTKEAPSKRSTIDGTELIKMLAGMM